MYGTTVTTLGDHIQNGDIISYKEKIKPTQNYQFNKESTVLHDIFT